MSEEMISKFREYVEKTGTDWIESGIREFEGEEQACLMLLRC